VQTVNQLKAGTAIRFGSAIVRDDGITLVRHKIFGANQPVSLTWRDVNIWSRDGDFYIGSRTDNKTYVVLSYQNDDNVPVLENMISALFKTGKDRVSAMLD